MNHHRTLNLWIIFAILIAVISVLWFLSDLKKTDKIQTLSEAEQELAKPIPNDITITLLDQFVNRLTISDNDLSSVQPYTSINTNMQINNVKSSPIPVVPDNIIEPIKP